MLTELRVRGDTRDDDDPVFIERRNAPDHPIRLRVGDLGHAPRNAFLTTSQAKQIARFLLAAAEGLEVKE